MGQKSKEMTNDVRKLIVEIKLEGKKTSEIENLLGISDSTIRSIWKKVFEYGGDQHSKEKRTSFQDVTAGSGLARS